MYPPANQIHCFQIMAVNGEIYNHKELIAETPDFVPRTGSDCEALIGLYEKGENMRFSTQKYSLLLHIFDHATYNHSFRWSGFLDQE